MSFERKSAGQALSDRVRNLSIKFTLTVNLLYLGYLIYAISVGSGIRWINIALAIATVLFTLTNIAFRLMGKGGKRGAKASKRWYKRFKLVTKLFSIIAAGYGITTALASPSLINVILSYFTAVIWCVQVLLEILVSAIDRKIEAVRKRKEDRANRRAAMIAEESKDINDEDVVVLE